MDYIGVYSHTDPVHPGRGAELDAVAAAPPGECCIRQFYRGTLTTIIILSVLWLIYIAGDGLGYGLGFLSYTEEIGSRDSILNLSNVKCSA